MLPQFGFSEFLLLAVAALIVVGPKDLPMMMRKIGQFVGKARGMAREFQAAFDDIARQTELEELRQEIEALKKDNAVAKAADDLKAAEQDINSAVMRKHPPPSPEEPAADKPAKPPSAQTPEEGAA